jgi:hypothetical protein
MTVRQCQNLKSKTYRVAQSQEDIWHGNFNWGLLLCYNCLGGGTCECCIVCAAVAERLACGGPDFHASSFIETHLIMFVVYTLAAGHGLAFSSRSGVDTAYDAAHQRRTVRHNL